VLEFLKKVFTNDFMPHRMCYLNDSGVLWLNVISDSLVALAYYLIPFLLFYFTKRRRDISFHWVFVAFGCFILACGTTHLLSAVTVWNPVYRLEGIVKAVTAIASITTFAMLWRMMPTLIALPRPAQLAEEVEERRAAEEEVRRINSELEGRVARRTAELAQSEAMYRSMAAEQKRAAESLEEALDELRKEMKRRQSLESQLIQAQKMEAVGRLAGGVAHDFNNLLTVIMGYAEMLNEQVNANPATLESVQEIQQAAERASGLTGQLLAFSRRQVSQPKIISLNDAVLRIDKMLRRIIGEDVGLENRLAADLARVKIDPGHLDQVIMNLAVNSRDAMPEGGNLTIETANVELTEEFAGSHIGLGPGQYVMVSVSDTGTGMDAATKSRLFEPFFTTKEKGKGTGLGLAIVYGIVKQANGNILVYSEPGHGTVFKIYLPVASAAGETLPAPEHTAKTLAGTGTILLVEDEDQVRNLTRAMLSRLGYRILDAASAADALRLAGDFEGPIDLLLTDIVMPRKNGMELAKELSEARPEMKVLFMSGYTDNSVVKQGMLTSETPFIQKPFTIAALHLKVREILAA